MAANDKHIRHIMLYEFRKNNNASVATKNIEKLVTKWGQVIDNEGKYIID
jgi:hypothetical protein